LGLPHLLGVTADGQSIDPATMSPDAMKEALGSAKASLNNAIANIDILLGLIDEAQEYLRST
jgi:hypothetical protein